MEKKFMPKLKADPMEENNETPLPAFGAGVTPVYDKHGNPDITPKKAKDATDELRRVRQEKIKGIVIDAADRFSRLPHQTEEAAEEKRVANETVEKANIFIERFNKESERIHRIKNKAEKDLEKEISITEINEILSNLKDGEHESIKRRLKLMREMIENS